LKGKIFNAQEMQDIIAGNKTIFREVVKSPILKTVKLPEENCSEEYFYVGNGYVKCPYQIGQKISNALDAQKKPRKISRIRNLYHDVINYVTWKPSLPKEENE
jgi:hypothetical protein